MLSFHNEYLFERYCFFIRLNYLLATHIKSDKSACSFGPGAATADVRSHQSKCVFVNGSFLYDIGDVLWPLPSFCWLSRTQMLLTQVETVFLGGLN